MLQVGAAASEIPVRLGEPLAGYALRGGGCTGSHDRLCARAVVIDDGACAVLLMVLDLLYVPSALDALVRPAAARAAGVDAGAVLLCATHTHAAPANLATDPDVQRRVADAARDAARQARAAATPAILGWASRMVTGIAGNRRTPGGPADDTARFLVARTADGSRTIATIVEFACHATVLDHTATETSADLPGAMCRQLERQVGGTALYLQGAAGDVNPTVGGPTHDECERLGGMLAAAATGAVLQVTGLQRQPTTISPTLQTPFPIGDLADGRLLDMVRVGAEWAEVAVDPAATLPDAEETARARAALPAPPGAEDARLWIRQLRAETPNLFGVLDEPVANRIRLQRIDIGPDLALLAVPGEPFGATASALRTGTDRDLFVVGYAHQSVGYLPPAEEWSLGGYEVGCCLYTNEVESRIRAAAAALLSAGAVSRPR